MKNEEISLATKKAMANALQEAMKKKDFSKITVKEIIEACNINRNTFYYHFADMYALLQWMIKEEAIEYVQNMDLIKEHEKAMEFALDYVQRKADILRCAYTSIGREELKRYFQDDFISITDSILDSAQEREQLYFPEDVRQYLCLFLTEAIAGMLVRYIEDPNEINREATIHNIPLVMRVSITGMLKKTGVKKH